MQGSEQGPGRQTAPGTCKQQASNRHRTEALQVTGLLALPGWRHDAIEPRTNCHLGRSDSQAIPQVRETGSHSFVRRPQKQIKCLSNLCLATESWQTSFVSFSSHSLTLTSWSSTQFGPQPSVPTGRHTAALTEEPSHENRG